MEYRHILVALELSEESHVLIERAKFLAELLDARVSFIHIDGSHGEIYPDLINLQTTTGLAPLNTSSIKQLRDFEAAIDYPVSNILVGTGDLADKLAETIMDNNFDLLICGHHHDFWSRIISYSKHLINKSPIDILVIPIES